MDLLSIMEYSILWVLATIAIFLLFCGLTTVILFSVLVICLLLEKLTGIYFFGDVADNILDLLNF